MIAKNDKQIGNLRAGISVDNIKLDELAAAKVEGAEGRQIEDELKSLKKKVRANKTTAERLELENHEYILELNDKEEDEARIKKTMDKIAAARLELKNLQFMSELNDKEEDEAEVKKAIEKADEHEIKMRIQEGKWKLGNLRSQPLPVTEEDQNKTDTLSKIISVLENQLKKNENKNKSNEQVIARSHERLKAYGASNEDQHLKHLEKRRENAVKKKARYEKSTPESKSTDKMLLEHAEAEIIECDQKIAEINKRKNKNTKINPATGNEATSVPMSPDTEATMRVAGGAPPPVSENESTFIGKFLSGINRILTSKTLIFILVGTAIVLIVAGAIIYFLF